MTRPLHEWMTAAALLASLALVGCGSSPPTSPAVATPRTPGQPSTVADTPRPPADPQMQALLDRLDGLEQQNQMLQHQLRQRQLEEIEQRSAQLEAAEQARRAQAQQERQQTNAQGSAEARPAAEADGQTLALADATRRELVDALLADIAESSDDPRLKALNAAAVSLLTPRHDLDHRLLNDLDPRSREQVARFHQMVAVTYDQLVADPGSRLDMSGMIDRLSEVVGEQPLSIKQAELCRRVDGYGVYEVFEGHRFPAGQVNRMLVYIEIDDFIRQPTAEETYQVKVSVELELYDRRGEVVLWRQQPETIVDESRNLRRDFFLIQPVNLPASLGVGEYRLKVRVRDLHSGSLAESTISDLRLLADQAVAGQGR
ncbi:MAG: hypothetical protein AAGC44_00280 [Planctomycetota bacterium]